MKLDDHALTGTGFLLKWLVEHFVSGPTDDISECGVCQFA